MQLRKKPEKNPGLQRGLNPWPRDTGAMLYQLSYEAFWVRDIWHKYHLRYFKIVSNFTRLTVREITYNNFEISLVVFMWNITTNHALLYRYWWNTRIFPFTKKSSSRAYLHLSRVRILVSPWLLTWLANYKRAFRSGARLVQISLRYKIFLFFIKVLTFWNRKYKYYCLYFSFITLYPSFITFCDRHFAIGDHCNCIFLLFRKWI